MNCGNLISIILPNTLYSIGANMITYTKISKIFIPFNVTDFTGVSLNQAMYLTKIEVDPLNPNLISHNNCVYNRNLSTLVTIAMNIQENDIFYKDQLTSLGSYVFAGKNIEEFHGSEKLTFIPSQCLHATSSLSVFDISACNITSIPYQCIYASAIKTLKLPNCLKTIESSAIYRCNNLVGLMIPPYVEKIADNAFQTCQKLEIISYIGQTNFSSLNLFNDCPKIKLVRVSSFYPSDLFSFYIVTRDALDYSVFYSEKCKTGADIALYNQFIRYSYLCVFILL